MPIAALALVLLFPLALIALMPIALVQRYRTGTARRLARPWVATFSVVAMTFSVVFFLAASAVANFWVPNALAASLLGIAVGGVLGVVGLLITRWEPTPRSLHYTPNRWLVLGVTMIVTARLLYGFWRGWMTVRAGADASSWMAAFGVAGSLGAGATVLGYYFAYGIGLRHRIRKWQNRALRVM